MFAFLSAPYVISQLALRLYPFRIENEAALARIPRKNRGVGMLFVLDTGATFIWDPNSTATAATGRIVDDSGDVGRFVIVSPAGGLAGVIAQATASWKPDVRVATASALAANTRTANTLQANANGALAMIDGVSIRVGDNVLVQNEVTAANNGVYRVTSVGSVNSKWSFLRREDADADDKFAQGIQIRAREGTTNGGKIFYMTNTSTPAVNLSSLAFGELSAKARGRTAGTRTLVGGTVAVPSITISASARVMVSRAGKGSSTTIGFLDVPPGNITPGVGNGSFVIQSLKSDGTVETGDLSIVNYEIVEP